MNDHSWMQKVDWAARVNCVLSYYDAGPHLKYGPAGLDKAFPVLDTLCTKGVVSRLALMDGYSLSIDGISTILSNVTKAIQGSGDVWAPQSGGWYLTAGDPPAYVVCPGFAQAWKEVRANTDH